MHYGISDVWADGKKWNGEGALIENDFMISMNQMIGLQVNYNISCDKCDIVFSPHFPPVLAFTYICPIRNLQPPTHCIPNRNSNGILQLFGNQMYSSVTTNMSWMRLIFRTIINSILSLDWTFQLLNEKWNILLFFFRTETAVIFPLPCEMIEEK